MKMFEVEVSPDDGKLHIDVPTVQGFRRNLEEYAPLPWEIKGKCIYDAKGRVILQASDGALGDIVLGAVLCGVATVGGYGLEN